MTETKKHWFLNEPQQPEDDYPTGGAAVWSILVVLMLALIGSLLWVLPWMLT